MSETRNKELRERSMNITKEQWTAKFALLNKFEPEFHRMYFEDVGVNYTTRKWLMREDLTPEDLMWELVQMFYKNNKIMKEELLKVHSLKTFPSIICAPPAQQ